MPLIFCFLPNQNDSVPFKQKTKGQNHFPFAWLFLEFIFDFEDFYLSKLTRAKMCMSINDWENMTFFLFCFVKNTLFFTFFFYEKISIYCNFHCHICRISINDWWPGSQIVIFFLSSHVRKKNLTTFVNVVRKNLEYCDLRMKDISSERFYTLLLYLNLTN